MANPRSVMESSDAHFATRRVERGHHSMRKPLGIVLADADETPLRVILTTRIIGA